MTGHPHSRLAADAVEEPFVRAFVQGYLTAWNQHDPTAILALADDEVTWIDPTIPGGIARDHAAIRSWLVSFFAAFPDVEFSYLDGESVQSPGSLYFSADFRQVAAPWRCRGTLLGTLSPPGLAPTGRRFDISGIDLYGFRGGRLIQVRTMTDVLTVAGQVGLLPAPGSLAERVGVQVQRMSRAFRRR